jgi:perosamine synthetase
MSSPELTDADVAVVNKVLETRYLSLGPKIDAFEQAFASEVGTRHAVGVN